MQKRELETISARELREILFHITDDSMTAKELRAKLYEVREQDEQVIVGFAMEAKLGLK